MSVEPTRRRAVVLVGGPAAPYSRGLRIARALEATGFRVEIAAVAAEGLPVHQMDGRIEIRRYRPTGPFALMAPQYRGVASDTVPARPARVGRLRHRAGAIRRWLFWPHTVRGWWATLRSSLAPADLYHACGSLTIAAALAARSRDARSGRRSVVVYDAIDDIVGSNATLEMPGPVRRSVAARERQWARLSDARITVNDALADRLAARWGVATAPLVVPNWPDASAVPAPSPALPDGAAGPSAEPDDRIRVRLGLPTSTRVVLFQGRLGPNLGVDEAAEAVLLVPDAALVLLGFGLWLDACRARDHDPRYQGRHFTLPAVHPDELIAWTSSADVALVPLPPISENQRASTPNKFWEAIAAGTPLVVGPRLPVMGDLVERFDLGVIAASLAADDLAAAIRGILDAEPAAAAERRRRIATTARERFSWPVAAARYGALVESLDQSPSVRNDR
jgi:glycosyltransferase involved in cell wall biosynthesis